MDEELATALLDMGDLVDRAYAIAIREHRPDVADVLLRAKQEVVEAVRRFTRRPIAVKAVLS